MARNHQKTDSKGSALISRQEAIKRLRHRWLAQTSLNPEIIPIFPLEHFVNRESIEAVQRFDLYSYYSQPRHHHLAGYTHREAIEAWLDARDRRMRQ